MAKSRNRPSMEINAGSMADIAFLLLLFFLMVTTIDVDKGITVVLPPWPESEEDIEQVDVKDRNILTVLINAGDQLLVEGEPMNIGSLKETTKTFLSNKGRKSHLSDSPQKAVVSLKNHRATSYDIYIQVQNELKAAYNELRDKAAMEQFGVGYAKLDRTNKKLIRSMYPIKISEAEPDKTGE